MTRMPSRWNLAGRGLVYSSEPGDEVLIGCYEPANSASGERMTIEVL